jgi:uncharacterized Zn finger protein (UPF0148 family)
MGKTEGGYSCKECGKPAYVQDGKIIRTCKHDKAVVVTSMSAVATGEGKVTN